MVELDWSSVLARGRDETTMLWLVLSAVVLPVVHFVLHRNVFTPVGRRLLRVKDAKKTDEDQAVSLRRLEKFEESAWKCVAYLALSAASGYALSNQTFWRSTHEFWTGCTSVPCEFETPGRMRFAYALDMAYYTYAIPYCILFETKRKDFWATMSHHIVTVALIGYSYVLGFTKVGVVIMFLHDVCDSPLEMAKMAKYAGWEAVTNAIFVGFTALWIGMRVVYFPFWVIWSVLLEAPVAVTGGYDAIWPHWHLFAGMLIFLWILHVYWTYVILKIAFAAVSSGSTDDTREDDD